MPTNQHQTPACALRHNNMVFLYWHGLHIKSDINIKTFHNVLFFLALSSLADYSFNALFMQRALMLFMFWKKSPRVLKILRVSTLLSCHAMWINFPLSLWGACFKTNQTFDSRYRWAPCPARGLFSPGQPSSHQPLVFHLWPPPLACPNPFL